MGEAHRRFTAFVNARARTTGHLFQGRFGSFAMDDAHFLNALRYLAFNPVRAGLAATPEALAVVERARASSRARRCAGRGRSRRWSGRRGSPDLLELSLDEQAALDGFEGLSLNGRPLGAEDFIARVET